MPLSKIQGINGQVTPNLGRRNLIINGAMQVAQRGTSSTGQTTGGYKTVDRFRTDHNGFTGSYTQATDVPSGYGFSHSYKIEVTTAASSDAGTLRFDTRVEAQNLRNSGWNYTSSSSFVTFSCWVKSSLAGTYYFGFRTDDGTSRQYTEAFTLVADTWKKLEISIPGDSSVTFNNDNGMGALIALHMDERTAQSDSGHTLNGWQNYSSSSRTPDFSQNWSETLNATFHTTGWQLEVGDTSTDFEHRSFAEELALCQRYYIRRTTPNQNDYPGSVMGWASTSGTQQFIVQFEQQMRVSPTFSFSGDFRLQSNSDSAASTGLGAANISTIACRLPLGSSAYTGDQSAGGVLQGRTAGGYIAFDSEL